MKGMILFLLGLIPFVLGFLMNSWLMQNQNSVLPSNIIGIIFLIFWVLVGFITCKHGKKRLTSTITINLTAFLILLLIMYQEAILDRYWSNIFGWSTQIYYLALINISSFLLGIFLPSTTVGIWPESLIAFLLMFASYYIGCYLNKVLSK